MRYVSLNTSDVAQSQPVSAVELMEGAYEVRYRGPHAKWGVVRVSDSALLKDGMQTKDEAESFRRDYLRTITA